jgi:hypothetical protein
MDKSIAEYFVGQSGGYGGGAMTGGAVAPTNWAGTFSSNQTSRRLNDYPASRRYTYMQGNTVIGSSLYDTITSDDLKHPRFSPQEIFTGLRKEMSRMEYPDKDVAKQTVLKNLDSDPKYYSDLHMYFNSDKEGSTIMENIDQNELKIGIQVEKEHTQDEALATKIAMDHLKEDPKYYTKLKAAGLEEYGNMDIGNVSPIAPSIAVVKLAAPVIGAVMGGNDDQEKLTSSGLGSSGVPKPLKSDKLEAPEESNKVGPNSVAVSKTPPIGGQAMCDPLDHYGAQMNEKW